MVLGIGDRHDNPPARKRGRPASVRRIPTRKEQQEAKQTVQFGVSMANMLGGFLNLYKYEEDPLNEEEQVLLAGAIYGEVEALSPTAVIRIAEIGHMAGPHGELIRVAGLLALPRLAVRKIIPPELAGPLMLALLGLKEVADGSYVPEVGAEPTPDTDTPPAVPVGTGPDDGNHRGNGYGEIDGGIPLDPYSEIQLDLPDSPGPGDELSSRRGNGRRKSHAEPAVAEDTSEALAAVVSEGSDRGPGGTK